ncbi:hypothetical protein ASD89_02150 [Caulobacter sp. Root656]|nr:hypothetical protein ASD89_02150 [Caulobacter sp. Root656]
MRRLSMELLSRASLSVLAVASLAPAVARAAEPVVAINLPPGPMQSALVTLASQANVKILFETDLVAHLRAPALQGQFTAREALERLLAGSHVAVDQVRPGVLVLRPARIAASTGGVEGLAPPPADLPAQASPSPADPVMVSEIVVGTHIRGVKDGASPVIVLGREDIDRAGYDSVAEALTALPQAFGGTDSEDSVATGADPNGTNMTRGTGLDLRGLGADATLVLVNGRRMAGAGSHGDFADIAAIPYTAVGRVEVLLDGASALYGADAVGGVVNIRLRTDLEGADTRASASVATQGGYSRRQFGQAFGHGWDGGHLLAAYEYTHNSRLHGQDRDYAGNADLRGLGGTDRRRTTYSQPANILRLNAAGAFVAAYAVPAGQDGTRLRPGDFLAGTVNAENQRAAYDILPRSTRHSVLLAANQRVGVVDVSADLRYSRRDLSARNAAAVANLTVTAANPYYVSPTGQASERLAYSFLSERGGTLNAVRSESLGASLGADIALPAGWNANLYGAFAQELGASLGSGLLNATKLNEAAGLAPDSPLSRFSAARDGYFNPFIGAGANPAAVLDFVLSGQDVSKTRSETRSVNLAFDGPLLSLPGGTLRLAVGGQAREERLRTSGVSYLTGYAATARTRRVFDRRVRSVYAELNAPLIGPDNARPLVERLELSLAGRVEDYDDVGSTRNPKIGLIWAPSRSLTFKGGYGTSFRAPALPELNSPFVIAPTILPYNGGQTPVLLLQGGNLDLKPETARSWTAGVTYSPADHPGLSLGLSVYRTLFKGRIGSPVLSSLALALTSPEFAPFRSFVAPATSPADRARVLALVNDPHALNTGLYAVDTYGAIVEARNVNTGSLDVRGVDLTGAYATTLRGDPLTLNASLSWLTRYERKVTPTATATQLAGQAGYPADLRARVSATWTHGPAAITTSLSHVGDTYAETGRRVAPWNTVDLQLRLQPRAPVLGVKGLAWTLNVQNLFDSAPPFYDNPLGIGYDPANADPIGRRVTLQLTKAW